MVSQQFLVVLETFGLHLFMLWWAAGLVWGFANDSWSFTINISDKYIGFSLLQVSSWKARNFLCAK